MRELRLMEIGHVAGGQDSKPSTPPSGPSSGDKQQPNQKQDMRDPHEALGAMDMVCNFIGTLPGPIADFYGKQCEAATGLGKSGAEGIDTMKDKSMGPAAEVAESL